MTSMIWVGPLIVRITDKSHHVTIDCTVTDAVGERPAGSTRSRSPHDRVIIQTAECGKLLLKQGINESNRDAVAAELVEGKRFSFEVGGASLKLQWAKMTPPVWSYQKIG
ncbi:hypothetical protein [Arthrobacter sunyaminii]|uniref:hypothetical protein n=1 Tax=Arthrobacter sunyaminii TaxID=2816859 RepID=UPI001A946424|nr:hypothetical protein [Arthrobacter sunyaminii]MBO0895200.1 hypothetical protein [Arthrobacter sunyaminii]